MLFLNNRYHDPITGQFISVDPLVTLAGEPYLYGSANPITFSDPSGLFSCYVPENPWACLDLAATIAKVGGVEIEGPGGRSATSVRLDEAPVSDFTVKWFSTAALASNFNDQQQIGPTVEHHGDGWTQVYELDEGGVAAFVWEHRSTISSFVGGCGSGAAYGGGWGSLVPAVGTTAGAIGGCVVGGAAGVAAGHGSGGSSSGFWPRWN